jgi:AraC-like DNA-binding protein
LAVDDVLLTDRATVSGFLVAVLGQYAAEHDLGDVAGTVPVDPEAHVPAAEFLEAWRAVRAASADPDFGLHLGEFLAELGDQHAVGQLLVHCPTVGEALRTLCRVHSVLIDPVTPMVDGDRLVLRPSLGEPDLTEAVFANLAGTLRRLGGRRLAARAVSFTHRRPARTDEHLRVFGVTPRFGRPRDEIGFGRAAMARPLRAPNPRLRALLEDYVVDLQRRLRDEHRTSREVLDALGRLLPDGRPTLADVARELATSPRAMQARLRREGIGFQALLDQVRRDAAEVALRDPDRDLADIALMLGFADQSAFQRAFKRWTGRTPGEKRAGRA